MYKISLIVSISNSEKKIMDFFNSFLNQTFDFNELEIIFVYNKNDSKICSILKSLVNWYPNVYECQIETDDKWDAYNVGLECSSAENIIFVCEENFCYDYTIKTLYGLLSEGDIVCGNYVLEKNNNLFSNELYDSFKNGYAKITNKYNMLDLLNPMFPVELILFKKKYLIENNIRFEHGGYPNLVFLMKVFSNINSFSLINKPLFKLNSKESKLDSIYNRKDFFNLITSYENVLNFLKNELNIEKVFSNQFSYIINQLIYSKLSKEDKLDLIFSLNKFFERFNISKINVIKSYEKLLFILIKEKKYLDALNIIDFLNSTEDYFLKRIKSKDILCLFYGFEYDIGGLAKAVFNRVNLLSEKGHNVILLNVDPFTDDFLGPHFVNISFIEEKFRNLNYINPNVKFYNALQYFHDMYSNDFIK